MKKTLAAILALVLTLSLCSLAWADGEGTASGSMSGVEFLAKAKDGVITLTGDVTLSSGCKISDGNAYTINLNGKTLSAAKQVISLTRGKVIVNGTGTIKENAPYLGAILVLGSGENTATNYSVVEVNAGVTLEGWAPIFVDQNGGKAYGVSVTVNGATLNARKDTSGDGGAGIYVNGQIADENNAPVISLTNTKICDVDNASQGMYLAGYTTTTLTNCNITGMTGVEIRAGKLTVNGGSFTATAPYSVSPNGNGSTTVGAAIAVAQHTTKKNIEVALNGGTYTGEKAISESNPQANDPAPQVAMSVTAGTFVGDVVTADVNNFITGGTFSSAVDTTYLADTVNYKVSGTNSVSYFTNLNDAMAAANAEDEITNVREEPVPGSGYTVKLIDNNTVIATLHSGASSVALPTLSKSGYTFKGWKEENGSTVYTDKYTPKQSKEVEGDEIVPVEGEFKLYAVWSANSYYYYPSTSTTDSTTGKASPKTFDAGVALYAGMALASLTGLAYTGKKKF